MRTPLRWNAQCPEERLAAWISSVSKPVVVELGAGKALPTVRRFSERNARQRFIRINPRELNTNPLHGVGFEGGAAATLKLLDAPSCESQAKGTATSLLEDSTKAMELMAFVEVNDKTRN